IKHLYGVAAALIRFEPNIIGLQVTMDDPLAVRFMDRGTHLFQNIQCPANRQIAFLFEYLAERAAVEILHYEVSHLAVVGLGKSKIGYIYDVRMPQTPCSPSFPPKTLDEFRALHILRRDHLDRNRALGAEVCSKIDRAHPSASEFAL